MDPSPRVRLEVALLDADPAAPAPDPSAPQAGNGERPCLTVLAVAAEADLRVVEAASVGAAIAIAAESSPALLVVDEPERAVIDALAGLPAIVIVDELSQGAPASRARCRLLPRPFTGETLMAEVTRLLAT
jgi:hypothetical protein